MYVRTSGATQPFMLLLPMTVMLPTTAVTMTEMLSLLMTMLSLQGGSSVVDGKSDGQDFQRLTSAMEVLGIRVSW